MRLFFVLCITYITYSRILNHVWNYQDVARLNTEPYFVRNVFMCSKTSLCSQEHGDQQMQHETPLVLLLMYFSSSLSRNTMEQ